MATSSINTKTSDTPISEYDAELQQFRIREIMAETREPFGPAVDIYIKEQEDAKAGNNRGPKV
jgi:hypothetical protein